ncbi:MAG: metallophosphoesterase [Euryarchaeota archaeon]|nr:metallophosphoesterase [Euryarchaeota archaeon]
MKIAHISDTHFSNIDRESFDNFIKKINSSNVEFVVHTGDIVSRGYLEEYEEAIQSFTRLKKPIIYVPGNHDGRNVGLELFKNLIGPLRGVREDDNYVVIYLNSVIPDMNGGRISNSSFLWLKRTLMRYIDKEIKIVGFHHHLIPVPHTGRERNVLFNAGDVLNLLIRYGVTLVLNGHKHYPNVYKIEDLVISNAGTMCSLKTRLGDTNSFNVIEINDKVKVQTIRPDKVRERTYKRKKERIYNLKSKSLFKIVQITGTFIDDNDVFNEKMFLNALKKIKTLDPDYVIHCGDIVNEGMRKNYDLASEYFNLPIFFIPGPRDINYLGYKLFPKHFEPVETYIADKIAFKFLNTCQYDSHKGVVGRDERDRIKQFSKTAPPFKTIALHHNLLPIENTRERGLLEDAGDVLHELTRLKIDLVLTGHSSHPSARKIEDTLIVNANSLSCKRQRSLFGNSFNVIDVYKDFIYVSEIQSLSGSRHVLGIWKRD